MTNVAARLCNEAMDGQILVSQRVAREVEALVETSPLGDLRLKGLSRAVRAFSIEFMEMSRHGSL